MLGCIVANIPFFIPGINENLRLGLTGGPLVVAILIGYFGPKYNLVTYNTISANLMLRESASASSWLAWVSAQANSLSRP